MSVPIERTAIVLLASGLSRRYGRRDKLFANLGGRPLVGHAASALAQVPGLARVAVCPTGHKELRDKLTERYRFVLALNREPKRGLGHSIALGAQVALQFKPEAIVFCMGDMPFIEPWLIEALVSRLGQFDIVHAGSTERMHPPTAFGPACFDQLRQLDGDDGAKRIIGQGGFRVAAFNAPEPLLVDVDTREALDYAERQLKLRKQFEAGVPSAARPVDNSVYESQLPPLVSQPHRASARSS
jgi:molybdenum cofactor cytidylyltransferase